MTSFDRVLPELLRLCHEDAPSTNAIDHYCVVRDVRGRIRLVVRAKDGTQSAATAAIATLQRTLEGALGNYFVAPIVSTASQGTVRLLATKILEQAQGKWPPGWPTTVANVLGGAVTAIEVRRTWTGIERTIGKEAWLAIPPPAPPWLLRAGNPPIVTFHSFKGGVGRTTLVAGYAIWLASQPSRPRVAIVDLDLEAPGVGSLFEVTTERGVLDLLVDHIATDDMDLGETSGVAQLSGPRSGFVTVFPAGRVDDLYLQKLARLDFSSAEPGTDNPVGLALTAMLKKMKADFDMILVDARAGLHDLAGMSLHGLAHVDVLVFRGTAQNLAGLEQTLRTLRQRDTKIVLVESLLPGNDDDLFRNRQSKTRSAVYEMCCRHVYEDDDEDDDIPQLGDLDVTHDVVSVRRKEWLDGIDSLHHRVTEVLSEGDLNAVATRITEACGLGELATDDDGEDEL
jgi:MinD-like ATPase involved in chromosome partitioning or flagellar assembly